MTQATDTDTRILDAARTQVRLVGYSRTTLTDVAERAGLSRRTIYRVYPDVTSVLQALMWREFGSIIEWSAAEPATALNARGQIVSNVIRGVELITTNELFLRLLDVDPALLLPYMTHRPGRFQDAAIETIAGHICNHGADGSIRKGDPQAMAHAVVLALRGYAFSARAESTRAAKREGLDNLARMIDGLLRPDEPRPRRTR
jgi:AcrR family transcriptional regulator